MLDWLMLLVQTALAIAAFDQLRCRVFPALNRFEHPAFILDVWVPLTLLIPMFSFVNRVDGSVRGPGWMLVGAPPACGAMALAWALMVAGERHRDPRIAASPAALLIWTGTGAMMLMLTAAHHLSLWVGQCAFLLGAVVLWLNTPEEAESRHAGPMPNSQAGAGGTGVSGAGMGMTVALLLSIGQAAAALSIADEFAPLSAAVSFAWAVMIVASMARLAGPDAGIRLGGWTASLGLLLGLGLISLAQLYPNAIEIIRTGQSRPIANIAFGFGAYALEAVLMLLVCAGALLQQRLPSPLRRRCGWALFLFTATLAGWRLARMD